MEFADTESDPSVIFPIIEHALKTALVDFESMRKKEGAATAKHISTLLQDIEDKTKEIENHVPAILKVFHDKLINRLKEIQQTISDTDERVKKEVALLAEHSDIAEETTRMKSHISQFRGLLKKEESVGKTMDFLLQEMMREINTMSSKAVDIKISPLVVSVKSSIEKIREQIQNIE
jgi:uncharacterized protein (TIGR00255 family)